MEEKFAQISIIIPNFNGKKLLANNLPFISKAAPGAEIIIVDDGSTDGSVDFIRQQFPQIKLIEKVLNDGFSISVNLGVKAATKEIIYLLNSDVVPQKDFLTALLPHFNDPQIFAVGSLDLSYENGKIIKRGRGIGIFTKGFLLHSRGEVDKSNTLWAAGGSSVFRKSIWKKLGGLQELYSPFYWEDIDLSYRAQKAGYKIVFEPKSIVEHHHDQGSIKQKYTQGKILEIAYRNQIIFVWLNITDRMMLWSHLVRLPYLIMKSLAGGEVAFFKGLVSAFLLLPQVLAQRSLNLKYFKLSDKQILGQFI